MNRAWVEGALRQVLQKVGVVGKRGPVPAYIFPLMLLSVPITLACVLVLIHLYEYVRYGKCPFCRKVCVVRSRDVRANVDT